MRNIVLLLFMAVNCYCYGQFATFTPQVYQPVQHDYSALQRSLEQIETRKNEAIAQFQHLKIMLAEYGNRLNNDEATLKWFDNYKKDIERAFNTLSSVGWDDARDYAIEKQSYIANDPELKARIRTAQEYQSLVKKIKESKYFSQDEKREWILNHPYYFIPMVNGEGVIIGGSLGTKAQLDEYNAKVASKMRNK